MEFKLFITFVFSTNKPYDISVVYGPPVEFQEPLIKTIAYNTFANTHFVFYILYYCIYSQK